MPSNDEVVWGIPSIQCPICQSALDLSGTKIEKYSKAQRYKMYNQSGTNQEATKAYSAGPASPFNREDQPDETAENVFIPVSCSNRHCSQYSKIKILRIPRLYTPSVKVDL